MEFVGFEKLSLVDYDSVIGATLFTCRCQFRCPFCHNSSLVVHPKEAKEIPFEEILSYLEKRKGVLEGVTITGGEPTLLDDLEEKIKAIKALGYKVKLDTNGYNPKILKDLVNKKLVDYVAMDIKNSKKNYAQTVGLDFVDLTRIDESVSFLKEGHVPYEFRTTLIEEFHSFSDIKDIAEWLEGSEKYFLQKFIDRNTIKEGLHEVDIKKAKEFLDIVNPFVKYASLRGYDN